MIMLLNLLLIHASHTCTIIAMRDDCMLYSTNLLHVLRMQLVYV